MTMNFQREFQRVLVNNGPNGFRATSNCTLDQLGDPTQLFSVRNYPPKYIVGLDIPEHHTLALQM